MNKQIRLSIISTTTLILFLMMSAFSVQGSESTLRTTQSQPGPASSPVTFSITPTNVLPRNGPQVVDPAGIQRLISETGAQVSTAPQTGAARFVRWSASNAQRISTRLGAGAAAEDQAATFFREYGSVFGVADAAAELILVDTRTDNLAATRLTYDQVYRGVPVFAGRLFVHFNAANAMTAVNGIFIPKVSLNTTPAIKPESAGETAVAHVAAQLALKVEDPQANMPPYGVRDSKLLIFRAGLAKGVAGTNHLAYEVEVTNDVNLRDFVYVDAHTGTVIDRISGIHEDISRRVYDGGYGSEFEVWAEEDGPYLGDDPDIKNIIEFTEDSYNLFANITGGAYLSYDRSDARMEIVNNDPRIGCPNANWNGISTNYCTGVTGDDTVAHEWAHAYTDFTHNLIYQWQSGALNESYSDIFGEIVDFTNGAGTDSPGGPRTLDACSIYQTTFSAVVVVNSPASITDTYPAGTAAFGPPIDSTGITGDLVLVDDGDDEAGGASTTDGCQPLVNAADVNGKIAIVDRGTCSFTIKVKNAQDAGAIGAIVANHATGGDGIQPMSGDDPTITIPSLFIGFSNGNTIKAELPGVNVTLKLDVGDVTPDDSYRWLSGEDDPAFGGAIRDMWTPSCFGDPGKVTADEYFCALGDGGGVHTNSGVPNHAFALLVDGGDYNGQVVGSLGLTKTAHIYWRAMSTYQHQATDFPDHADALEQSCTDLVGVDLLGLTTGTPSGEIISAADCTEVSDAIAAVEFRTEPTQCDFQPLLAANPPALCSVEGGGLTTVFSDTFETSPTGWTLSNEGVFEEYVSSDWAWISSLPANRSGSAFFGVDDITVGDCSPGSDDQSGVKYLDSPVITIPTTSPVAHLSFDHYVATEALWDGGNLWISVNDGDWQPINTADFTFNPYNVALSSASDGNTNPLEGQPAFTGSDSGAVIGTWGQSQVNLKPYADRGDTVQLRFALGVDGCNGLDGWYVDDVQVYYCSAESVPAEANISTSLLSSIQAPNSTKAVTFTLANTGLDNLTWSMAEDAPRRSAGSNPIPEGVAKSALRLSSSPTTPSAPDVNNVVQDGGFEAGSPNPFWAEGGDLGVPIYSCADFGLAFEGGWCSWWGGYNDLHTASITQTVTISNTGNGKLSFWLQTDGTLGDVLQVSLDDTPVFTVTDNNTEDYTADYTLVSVDVSSFADGGSHDLNFSGAVVGNILVDNVALDDSPLPCVVLDDIPWLSVLPASGTTPGLQSSEVTATFDSTGLVNNVYKGQVCVTTNDPNNPLVPIDVELLVDATPTWEQEVMINSETFVDATTFPGIAATDVITLVDHISVASSKNVTFTLRFGWTESLALQGYSVSPEGSDTPQEGTLVISGNRIQDWRVIDSPAGQLYTITRTFTIAPGKWTVDRVSERLIVEGATTQLDERAFTFMHPLDIFLPLLLK